MQGMQGIQRASCKTRGISSYIMGISTWISKRIITAQRFTIPVPASPCQFVAYLVESTWHLAWSGSQDVAQYSQYSQCPMWHRLARWPDATRWKTPIRMLWKAMAKKALRLRLSGSEDARPTWVSTGRLGPDAWGIQRMMIAMQIEWLEL